VFGEVVSLTVMRIAQGSLQRDHGVITAGYGTLDLPHFRMVGNIVGGGHHDPVARLPGIHFPVQDQLGCTRGSAPVKPDPALPRFHARNVVIGVYIVILRSLLPEHLQAPAV